MDKIEEYINSLDTPNITMHTAKYGTGLGTDSAPLGEATKSIGALISYKSALPEHIIHSARVQMVAALAAAKPELITSLPYLSCDAQELLYIEHMRRTYGDELIDQCLDDARKSPRTFYHCLQLRLMAQRLNNDFSHILDAMANVGKAIAAQLARGLADVQNAQNAQESTSEDTSADTPTNRYERRSAKYGTRRKTESDQLWARRNNNPKRRR